MRAWAEPSGRTVPLPSHARSGASRARMVLSVLPPHDEQPTAAHSAPRRPALNSVEPATPNLPRSRRSGTQRAPPLRPPRCSGTRDRAEPAWPSVAGSAGGTPTELALDGSGTRRPAPCSGRRPRRCGSAASGARGTVPAIPAEGHPCPRPRTTGLPQERPTPHRSRDQCRPTITQV